MPGTQGRVQICRGVPMPHGCSQGKSTGRLNFALLAPDTATAWLEVELPQEMWSDAGSASVCLKLSPQKHKTGHIWHVEVCLPTTRTAGLRYAWLLDPPLNAQGTPAEGAERILDPYARMLDTKHAKDWNRRNGPEMVYTPSAVVPDVRAMADFNWEGVESPGHRLEDLIIYEAHVRGFTRHPDSGVTDWDTNAGSFRGFIEKIPHLMKMGVNCLELMPLFEFDETACPVLHPETGKPLCNYWGYQTVSYFVPMRRFAARAELAAAVIEFKTLVRELHRHGIEVILDVVFNHTGEGVWGTSNWRSLGAVAREHYYIMSEGYHTNYTGCGNTVNVNSPTGAEWFAECLRYWALEMHVDGFRFDLASALTRGSDGACSEEPLFVRRLASDPCLTHLKLIAEPWDCDWPYGYLVGRFPQYQHIRFAEWNGKFRDSVRQFIKGDPNMKGEMATRICGSADMYDKDGRGPCYSINFVACHDGFTLRDLVSYNKKRNKDNNEESGDDHNLSWNCGTEADEGPNATKEALVLREKQIRNFMVALFLSAGTPMITAGDEYGRTQNGNNNTWCQDALNWFSWEACAAEEDALVRFTRLLIAIRKQHTCIFGRRAAWSEEDITWTHDDWESDYNFLSFVLKSRPETVAASSGGESTAAPEGSSPSSSGRPPVVTYQPYAVSEPGSSAGSASVVKYTTQLLIAYNAGHISHDCHLPPNREWYRLIDTSLESPADICASDEEGQLITGENYVLSPYSVIVLKSFEDPNEASFYVDAELEANQEALCEHLRQVAKRTLAQELDQPEGDWSGGQQATLGQVGVFAGKNIPPGQSEPISMNLW
eukprot:CAMPEP_0178403256 /NCGR_PEP_ID=MMETSP0689_2-20121128/17273_1 /TAXON_ID=160604 /ORGANISM="Amphidinium massartii, Strain CS-259" /LENGTH=827 /DNA_ID=CAMNT_0020024201 /DNA_START=35 /DNA_END=2515 /DNA_ORIENTATION=-